MSDTVIFFSGVDIVRVVHMRKFIHQQGLQWGGLSEYLTFQIAQI